MSSELLDKLRFLKVAKIKRLVMDQGLRFRLGALFVAVSLVPLLILGFFSFYKSSNAIQDITSKYSDDIISEINTNMLLRFKNINDAGKILLNNDVVKDILSKDNGQAVKEFNEDNYKMTLILNTISDINENITSVYILSEKNNNIYAIGDVTQDRGLVFLNDEYRNGYKDTSLYKDTITENKKWWPTQNVMGKNVFILTEKLYDSDKGVLGVLVIHLSVEIMDDIYNQIKNANNSVMYLVDKDGRILFHPERAYIGKQLANEGIKDKVMPGSNGSFLLKVDKKPVFVVYDTFSDTGWKSIVVSDYDKLISEAEKIRTATLIVSLSCLGFALLFSLLFTRSILKPIYALMELMKKGSTGDMKVRFNVAYNDEIGQLGDCFNKMMSDIEKLIEMLEVESKQKVEAEIKVLEAHINPHFLYNTLASIYWSAMAAGNTEVGKMAASLSKFFRLGLNKGKEFTTVEKEVEHVKEYLSMQKMLYKNLFDYEVYADPLAVHNRTIKLVLQPLVENSLLHGIEKSKVKGFIKVEVLKKGESIVFSVTDNGSGIIDLDEKGIDRIIDGGYGLRNVRERLRLYFENDFTIDCLSTPGISTKFEIKIPAVISEEVLTNA